MSRTKKVMVFALALVVAAGFGVGAQAKKVKAAFIVSNMANESQAFSAKQFLKYGADYGFDMYTYDAKGDTQGVQVHYPRAVDVKSVRAKVGMTQEQFAARFGFSTATLRHWERGDRTPRGPALVLLNVIERNPGAVIAALA